MRYPSFDIAWTEIQKNPEHLHEVVLEWENSKVQDPAMLGLISRYHVHQGDVGIVINEMLQFKAGILNAIPKKKSGIWKRYVAAAVVAGLIVLGTLWIWNSSNRRTWSYRDEGIPQFMDDKVEAIDWAGINFSFRKEKYEDCLNQLMVERKSASGNDTLLYYSAYCYLELNERDSAIKYFSMVPVMGSVYSLKAKYFLFHLQPDGPDYIALQGLQNVQDANLRQAVRRDIAN